MPAPTTDHTPAPPRITLVAAVARNGVIGRGGTLVWSDPADLKHFRSLTQGHAVLMGRKTWDSLPARFRPLPGRRNLVVSRQAGLQLPGAEVHASLPQALAALAAPATPGGVPQVFVIGGGELYALALPLAEELVLTEVDADFAGDTVFPRLDPALWQAVQREPGPPGAGPAFAFVRYRRSAD
jgi:dihydrofolate reductase